MPVTSLKLKEQVAFVDGRQVTLGAPVDDVAGHVRATIAPILRARGEAVGWSPKSQRLVAVKIVFGWPLADQDARVTSPMGERVSPFDPAVKEFHSGIDLAAP
ncbi:MAG TPA: hypothetical protein VGL40_09480, partial [Bacillota bacterium]